VANILGSMAPVLTAGAAAMKAFHPSAANKRAGTYFADPQDLR
jgi:hypothetical protein